MLTLIYIKCVHETLFTVKSGTISISICIEVGGSRCVL